VTLIFEQGFTKLRAYAPAEIESITPTATASRFDRIERHRCRWLQANPTPTLLDSFHHHHAEANESPLDSVIIPSRDHDEYKLTPDILTGFTGRTCYGVSL